MKILNNYLDVWSLNKDSIYQLIGSRHGFYKKGKYIYKAICPFCKSGSKENKTSAFTIDDNSGAFRCFSCSEKGNLYKLAKHFNYTIIYPNADYQKKKERILTPYELDEIRKKNLEKDRQDKISKDNRLYKIIFENYSQPNYELEKFIERNKTEKLVELETVEYLRSLIFIENCKLTFETNQYLKNLNTIELNNSNELHAFSELYKSKLIIIQSFYGSGKTHKIINEVIDSKKQFIFVSVRIQLLKQITKRCKDSGLECEFYLDVDKTIGYKNYNSSICITPDSLRKLKHYELSNFIVIFDEAVTMLNKFDTHTIEQIESIKYAISNSYSCFILDKNFQSFHIDYLTKISKCEKRLVDGMYHYPTYINVIESLPKNNIDLEIYSKTKVNDSFISLHEFRQLQDSENKRKITEYCYIETLLNNLKTDILNEKNTIVYTDRKKVSNSIAKICKEIGLEQFEQDKPISKSRKFLLVNGDTSNTIDLSEIDKLIEENNIQVLIYTNSLSVGFSIEIQRHFSRIYAIIQFLSNGRKEKEIITGYEEIEQALHRLRDFKIPIYIHTKGYSRQPISIEKLTNKVIENDTSIKKFLVSKYNQKVTMNEDYTNEIELYINQLYYKNTQLVDTKSFVRENLQKLTNRYTINYENISFKVEKIKNENLSEQLIETSLVSETLFKVIHSKVINRIAITPLERLQYEKYNLYQNSKLTSETELNELLRSYSLINLRRVFSVSSIKEKVENNKQKEQEKIIAYNDTTNKQLRNLTLHEVFSDTIEVSKLNAVDILLRKEKEIIATGYNLIDSLYSTITGSLENDFKRCKDISEKHRLKEQILTLRKEQIETPSSIESLLSNYSINYTGFVTNLIEKSGYLISKSTKRESGKVINFYKVSKCST